MILDIESEMLIIKLANTAVTLSIMIKVPIIALSSGKIRKRERLILTINAAKSIYISHIFITRLLKGRTHISHRRDQEFVIHTAASWPLGNSPSKASIHHNIHRRTRNKNQYILEKNGI